MTTKADLKNNLQVCNSPNEEHPLQNGGIASGNAAAGAVKTGWRTRLVFALLLIILTTFVYLPSLDKIFTNDQLSYLLELNGEYSLASGFRLLDYAVERQYNKGDEVLYRPLLFVLLALESSLFNRDFRMWNIANIIFHLLVAYLLFEVLWRIKRTTFACGFALLFALLMSNFALVTWNHLGGYILGYGLLLIALWAAREMTHDEGHSGNKWFWIYGIVITAAMLFHEIAVIAAFGVTVYVVYCETQILMRLQYDKRSAVSLVSRIIPHAKPCGTETICKSNNPDSNRDCRKSTLNTRWIKFISATGVPILIYAVLYFFHLLNCNRLFYVDTHSLIVLPLKYLAIIPLLILHWMQHIFLPVLDQLLVLPMQPLYWIRLSGTVIPEIIFAVLLWGGTLFFLRKGFERNYIKKFLPFMVLIFFLIVSYAGMNIAGRLRHAAILSYYDYFPSLFGLLILYSLIDFSRVRRTSKLAAFACIFLLILNNGWHVRHISMKIQDIYSPLAQYLELVEQSVRPHLSNPDFSFYIKGMPKELNMKGRFFRGYPDQGIYVDKTVLHFLYGKYYNSLTPSHIFVFRDIQTGKVDLLTIK